MSVYDDIQTAAVTRYPYLWNREAGKGETEGRKRSGPLQSGLGSSVPMAICCYSFRSPRNTRSGGGSRLKSPQSKSAVLGLMQIVSSG